jgi:hypothetical protein
MWKVRRAWLPAKIGSHWIWLTRYAVRDLAYEEINPPPYSEAPNQIPHEAIVFGYNKGREYSLPEGYLAQWMWREYPLFYSGVRTPPEFFGSWQEAEDA